MHKQEEKRKYNRSRVWEDVTALVDCLDPLDSKGRSKIKVNGNVKNISSKGMFLFSGEVLPIGAKADITIDFDSTQSGKLVVQAEGKIVRLSPEGVGIEFSRIDLNQFQHCIMKRMNRS
jgi:hypothetical protein